MVARLFNNGWCTFEIINIVIGTIIVLYGSGGVMTPILMTILIWHLKAKEEGSKLLLK